MAANGRRQSAKQRRYNRMDASFLSFVAIVLVVLIIIIFALIVFLRSGSDAPQDEHSDIQSTPPDPGQSGCRQ